MFSYLSSIYIYKCPLSSCSSLYYINAHFFFNRTLSLCKAIVVTKQIFSSHKNPHYYYEKKTTTKQYKNGKLRASRLLRSYLTAEKKA